MGERIPTANEMDFSELTADGTQIAAGETVFQSVGLPNSTWKTTGYRRSTTLTSWYRSSCRRIVRST
jgi:hypothetical protein